MATTMTLRASNFCETGTHFTLTASGDIAFATDYITNEFNDPLTEEEKRAFLKALVRFARLSRTTAAVKTALLAGVTVTI